MTLPAVLPLPMSCLLGATDPRGGGLEEKGEDKGTEGTASCIFLSPSFFTVGRVKRALSITFRKPPKSVFCAVFSSHHRQS